MFLSGCGTAELSIDRTEDEPIDDRTNIAQQGLVTCNARPATGYVNGKAFPITIVDADGMPAEISSANAYAVMQRAAAANGVYLRVVSGFRTYAEQQYVYSCYVNCNCNGCNLALAPGYSNHQSGHAFDLNTSDPGVYNWLANNGGAFGFRRTVPSEPWHWEWWGGGPGGGPCGGSAPPPPPPPPPPEITQIGGIEAAGSSDINGDGKADVCARNNSTFRCHLSNGTAFPTIIDGPALSDVNGWGDLANYSTLRTADYTGDGKADVCARANDGVMCWPSTGNGFGPGIVSGAMSDANGWGVPEYYSTLRMADVNGDGKADICARGAAAFFCWLSTGSGFGPGLIQGPLLSNANGWSDPTNYATLRMGDVNGDGKDDVCARADSRVLCWLSNGTGFPTQVDGPELSDGNGWSDVTNWSTLKLADVDGDKKADLCARSNSAVLCYLSLGTSFGPAIVGPALSDYNGWGFAEHYSTLRLADLDADGDLDLCGRSDDGVLCWLWTGAGFTTQVTTNLLSDASGWSNAVYYQTIRMADVTGDGRADLCARASYGVLCWPSTGTGFGPAIFGPAWTNENGWAHEHYYTTLRIGD